MTPDEIKQARRKLGLSREQFRERLGISIRTLEEWERPGRRPNQGPPSYFYRAVRDLERELAAS